MKQKRIISICPASGVWAVFKEENGSLSKEPVTVWAAYEDEEEDGLIFVGGMAGRDFLDFVDEETNFEGYLYDVGNWLSLTDKEQKSLAIDEDENWVRQDASPKVEQA